MKPIVKKLTNNLLPSHRDMVGRTIKAIHKSWGETLYIQFEDSSIAILDMVDDYDDVKLLECRDTVDEWNDMEHMKLLGAITEDEFTEWREMRNIEHKSLQEEYDRQQFERLKAKLGE